MLDPLSFDPDFSGNRISMGLAVKVHNKTRNMESTLLLCGVTELKRGLCCLNVQNEALMISVTSYDRRKLLG